MLTQSPLRSLGHASCCCKTASAKEAHDMAGGLAIVLSGGGAKGAFQVGVVHELVVNRGVRLDIVAGVSTGAIQALGVAQDAVPALLDAWLGIRGNSSIYKTRPLGVGGGLLGEDALYDTGPHKRLP